MLLRQSAADCCIAGVSCAYVSAVMQIVREPHDEDVALPPVLRCNPPTMVHADRGTEWQRPGGRVCRNVPSQAPAFTRYRRV